MRASFTARGGCLRATSRLAGVCLVLLPLTACLVGPDFKKPPAPVAEKYLKARGLDHGAADYRTWWKAFNDPVLDRLIEIAYAQNLTLLSAGTRVIEARAALGVAIGEFYPQSQQATGGLTYIGESRTDPFSSQFGQRYFWRDTLGPRSSGSLISGASSAAASNSADAAYLASIATYDDVLVTLLGDVTTTYIGIRTTQRQIEIAQENVVKQRKSLQIARGRYTGGIASKLPVYQAENVLGQTESAIPQLQIQLDKGLNALRLLLGMPPQSLDGLLSGARGIPVPPASIAVGIPADLVRRRPDIRAAELTAAAQSAQVGIAEADLYPAFSLTGSFGVAASTIRPLDARRHVHRQRHHVRFRAVLQLEHSELRPDHQHGAGAGRKTAGSARRLSEHGAEGAEGGRGRARDLSAIRRCRSPISARASPPPRRRSKSR